MLTFKLCCSKDVQIQTRIKGTSKVTTSDLKVTISDSRVTNSVTISYLKVTNSDLKVTISDS